MKNKKAASLVLTLALFVTSLPAPAFAAESVPAGLEAQRSEKEAALTKAQTDLEAAKALEAEKKAAYEAAKADKDALEAELAESSDLKAAEALVAEKQAAVDEARASLDGLPEYDSGKYSAGALAEAEGALEAAISDLQAKETARNSADGALQAATSVKNEKQAEYDAAVSRAEQETSAASERVQKAEAAVQSAQTALSDAQAAYDASGKAFLDAGAEEGYSFESALEARRSNAATAGYLESDDFNIIYNDCLKPDSIRTSIGWIKECNAIRENLGLDPLEISYLLMIDSVFSAAYYPYGLKAGVNKPHIGMSWATGNNLTTGYGDPFTAWYYGEKVVSLAKASGTTFDIDLVNECLSQVEEEAEQNGHDFTGYYTTYWETRDDYAEYLLGTLNNGTADDGHYNAIKSPRNKYTGFAFSPESSKVSLWSWNNCASQSFASTTGTVGKAITGHSVQEFERQFNEFMAAYEKDLSDAEEALSDAQAEKTAADTALSQMDTSYVDAAEGELEAAKAEETSAQMDFDAAKAAYENAVMARDDAETALADQRANAHFWEAEAAASAALAEANNSLESAVTARNEAESAIRAKYPQAPNYEAAEAAYNEAKAGRESAEAAYNTAKAEYDAVLAQIKALENAKTAAKAELEAYKNASDYRPQQRAELLTAISNGKEAISAAETEEDVAVALAAAKAKIDQIKTDAQLTEEEAKALADAKEAAKTALQNYRSPSLYRAAQQTELANAVAAGKTAIDSAENIASVNTALAAAKAKIDQIKTDAQLKASEVKPAPAPPSTGVSVSIKNPSRGKGYITVKWKKPSSKNRKRIAGYQIQISTNPYFSGAWTYYAGRNKSSKKIKGLARKTTYYIRIRTYNGAAIGPWSRVKSKKTK